MKKEPINIQQLKLAGNKRETSKTSAVLVSISE